MNKLILLVVIMAFVVIPTKALAVSVSEIDNKCSIAKGTWIETCTLTLQVDGLTAPQLTALKNNTMQFLTKKEAYRVGERVQNSIDFKTATWSGNLLTITGTIRPGTQNYLGLAPYYNSSWWNSSYNYRYQVNVNTTVLTWERILVNLTINTHELILAGKMNSNCTDLRIVNSSDDGLLNYDWEGYSNGLYGCDQYFSIIWVQLNVSPSNNTYFYVYYDNPLETQFGNTTNTYSDYLAVWHFAEGTGTSPEAKSRTACTITAGSGGFQNQINTYGIENVGGAYSFAKSWFDCGDNFDLTGQFTLEAWFTKSAAVAGGTQDMFGKHCAASRNAYWILLGRNGDGGGNQLLDTITFNADHWNTIPYDKYNTWVTYASTYNTSHINHFANHTYTDSDAETDAPANTACVFLIGHETEYNTNLSANISEVRISDKVQTNNFLKMSFDISRYSEKLVWFGNETEQPVTTTTTTTPRVNETLGNMTEFCCIPFESLCIDNTTMAQKYNINNITTYAYVTCQYGCDFASNTCYPSTFNQNLWALLIITALIIAVWWWLRG